MKTVILAGGRGTRIAEETVVKPKPMVEIGGFPILWHIMNIYSFFRFHDFILAVGYKGEMIKDYFLRYRTSNSDIEIDLTSGQVDYHRVHACPWNVRIIDTGLDTLTGGRLLRLRSHLTSSGTFMLTYGDGVSDINIRELVTFHKNHKRIATLTAVRPAARFGTMMFDGDLIVDFKEKPQTGEGWINGGFFVLEPEVFDYLENDETILERDPLERLAADGQLVAFKHQGFWQCMDTMRDKLRLEALWESGNVPWKVWK